MKKLLPWLIVAALVVVAIFVFRSCKRNKEQTADVKEIIKIQHDTVHHWTDKEGRDHGRVQLAEADAATLRALYPAMDEMAKTLRVQAKQIQALTAMSVRTSGEVVPTVDTVVINDKAYQHFVYSDPYLKLDGVLSETPLIKYEIFDSLTVATFSKRKGFLGLGKKEIFVDAYSTNPNAHIKGLTGLRVASEPAKRFGVGPAISYGFDGQQWRATVGVSLQYSLIRF
jgi:hypothetical protein